MMIGQQSGKNKLAFFVSFRLSRLYEKNKPTAPNPLGNNLLKYNYSENAAVQFGNGFSCSQSVFATFAPDLGLKKEDALKIASAFGGGMVRQGEVCGAVTGALMTLGLKYGSKTADDEEKVRQASQKLMQRFKEENGSILCRDLLGHNLNTSEKLEKRKKAVYSIRLVRSWYETLPN